MVGSVGNALSQQADTLGASGDRIQRALHAGERAGVIQTGHHFPAPPPLKMPALKSDGRYAGIASIPRREANLALTLEAIYRQFDHIFIYFNGYDHVPSWADDPKISYFRSQDYIDLNATGKVFYAGHIDRGYFFTLDDDFIYPANYAEHMVSTINKYEGMVGACVHGSIFPENPEYYYLRTAIYQYQQGIAQDRFVCLPGTGSVAVKVGSIPLGLEQFMPEVMVDLTFAILFKQAGVPLVSVRRPAFWLQNTDRDGLYQQFTKSKTHHTAYAARYGSWAFDQYAEHIASIAEEIGYHNFKDDPAFQHCDIEAFLCAEDGSVPPNWSHGTEYYRRLIEFSQDVLT